MHVLMTVDGVGGVFTYACDLITALSDERVRVTVVSLGRPLSENQRAVLTGSGPAAVHELDLRLEWMEDPWPDLERAGAQLLALERSVGPDVIHANAFFCGAMSWRAPVAVVAHSCVCSWWRAVRGEAAPSGWDLYRRLIADGLAGADVVIAPTEAMLAALVAEHGVPAGGARVIHNGSSCEVGALAKEPFALAVGRFWDAAKNLAVLDGVAARLPYRVLAAGELPAEMPVSGADGPVQRLGPLPSERLAAVRRRAAVFVAPARYEPFGLAVLEAARDGCALVLGDIPSLRELWDGAAVFAGPNDVARLAAAIEWLLADPLAAAELGARAATRAQRYGTTTMARGYAGLYRELAAGRREIAA